MKELLNNLQELGLSGREAELYLALLERKELSAPEVSKVTTITRTKSYEVLQNLVKKGLCNETYKNGIKVFSSIEPTIAIENMLSVYEDEFKRKKKLADRFREDLVELHKRKEMNTGPLDYIEVLTDITQIRERWLSIQANSREEILGFSKPPYTMKNIEENVEAEEELIKKHKVKIKSIYEYEGLTPEETDNLIKTIEVFQEAGEEAKIIKELPMKLVISDETITMLALQDRGSLKPSISTMIVNHPRFAKAQKKVFESYWNSSLSIEEYKIKKLIES